MIKELLTIEFRYTDSLDNETSSYRSKTITIGIYNNLNDAIIKGNEILKELSKTFEIRKDDKFGLSNRLVTNCCYQIKGIQYFAKITKLEYLNLQEVIDDALLAHERYKEMKGNGAKWI